MTAPEQSAPSDPLTLPQAAAVAGRPYGVLFAAATSGELIATKPRGRWVVRPEDLASYLAQVPYPRVHPGPAHLRWVHTGKSPSRVPTRRASVPRLPMVVATLPAGADPLVLLARLKAEGVTQVIDVRAAARGRKQRLKSGVVRSGSLTKLCRQIRLRYAVHPELAYPSRRTGTRGSTRTPVGTLGEALGGVHTLPAFVALQGLVRRQRVCLLGEYEGPAAEWPALLAAALAPDSVVQVVSAPSAIKGG